MIGWMMFEWCLNDVWIIYVRINDVWMHDARNDEDEDKWIVEWMRIQRWMNGKNKNGKKNE